MNQRKLCIKELEKYKYFFIRHGANHDMFYNSETKKLIPVKRHDFDEDDFRYIMKEIGVKMKKK
nr:MAG TPA: HICA protein [Caudoviricetes sp.]DAP81880.1 MAG TPA: HICA protein [Caudoviricetes sp.]